MKQVVTKVAGWKINKQHSSSSMRGNCHALVVDYCSFINYSCHQFNGYFHRPDAYPLEFYESDHISAESFLSSTTTCNISG
ncbi:hypothetical protein [Niastella yeongjuensis]|uniref:hypothetical protein n=1 Tax=Niastella yeongjuensis TaxID=354355 RepID=UPI0008B5E9FB|nr:hypothetical protein [Niastella yeongjuensis]SEO50902.1 hypothetical protein SAMN05660816_02890 [Niastella yeongjuensis]